MKLFDYGPKLHVQIHVVEYKIIKTTLEPRSQRGTSWEVLGSENSKALEESINQWFLEYCSGREPSVTLPLDFSMFPPFTQKIFTSLSLLTFGQTLSYQRLAALAGNPNASRAAGNACGNNPTPLIIPCHRVLTSGSRLGGFSLGLELKKALLCHENIVV
ncbi:MAG TPA: methylated-DNA--[protein]-cysteine S-methyltransferase [Waddliaceae bacterium]